MDTAESPGLSPRELGCAHCREGQSPIPAPMERACQHRSPRAQRGSPRRSGAGWASGHIRRTCSLPELLEEGSSPSLEEFKHGLTSTQWQGRGAGPTGFRFHDSQTQRACAFCLVFQGSLFCGPGGGHGPGPGHRWGGDGWCWVLGGLPCPGGPSGGEKPSSHWFARQILLCPSRVSDTGEAVRVLPSGS